MYLDRLSIVAVRRIVREELAAVGKRPFLRRRTPEQLEAIRIDYESGMPTWLVVERHGIPLGSLHSTAYQHKWKKPRQQTPLVLRPSATKPNRPKKPALAAAPAFEVHHAEAHARHTLTREGYRIEHLGPARWRLNGIEIDRTLFVTIGYHVRTKRNLPAEWVAMVKASETVVA